MDNKYENIVPWNGANDTGRDVRMKLERNFSKVAANFSELVNRDAEFEEWINAIIEELKNFLRKDRPDKTNFLLSFLAGAVFGKDGFASGLTGFGARIDENGNGEMESLILRRFLEVPELRYNRISVTLGDKWNAPGAGIIEQIEPDMDGDGNLQMTGTGYLKLEEGEYGAIDVGDICMGIFTVKRQKIMLLQTVMTVAATFNMRVSILVISPSPK